MSLSRRSTSSFPQRYPRWYLATRNAPAISPISLSSKSAPSTDWSDTVVRAFLGEPRLHRARRSREVGPLLLRHFGKYSRAGFVLWRDVHANSRQSLSVARNLSGSPFVALSLSEGSCRKPTYLRKELTEEAHELGLAR